MSDGLSPPAVNYPEVVLPDIEFVKTGSRSNPIEYANAPVAFDIETSSVKVNGEKRAHVYCWQFGIGEFPTVTIGRHINDFVTLIDRIVYYYKLSESRRMIIYVHNLSYEFQFIRKLFKWCDSQLFLKERTPLFITTTSGIEFRCSWKLSGASLKNTGDLMLHNPMHLSRKKESGDMHMLTHTPLTPLTESERNYCKQDICVINEYIAEQIEHDGTIVDIPLTKTGRLRKKMKKLCLVDSNYKKLMKHLIISPDEYDKLSNAFQGGFTHANEKRADKIINDVSSFDFTSSYPAVMVSEKYPMSTFKESDNWELDIANKAVVLLVEFTELVSKIDYEFYISEHKCVKIKNPITSNGRVVCASKLTIYLTELDYDIVTRVYCWDKMEVLSAMSAVKSYLPRQFFQMISRLYNDKTLLKGVDGREVEYMLSKEMINSMYGMCVQKPRIDNIKYTDEYIIESEQIEQVFKGLNNSRTRFLYYPWGVWVTAYARHNLWSAITEIADEYIYSDTDSIKFTGKHDDYFKNYDRQIKKKITSGYRHHGLAVPTPLNKWMGVWDFEGTYARFKTLGAKRYLTEIDGKLQFTVAGVVKKKGMEYLESLDIDPFDSFKHELHIPAEHSGKYTFTYIDEEHTYECTDYLGNTTEITSKSSIHGEPAPFSISLSAEYLSRL